MWILWKFASLINQEKELNKEILKERNAINRVVAHCLQVDKLHALNGHIKYGEKNDEKTKSCSAGTILRDGSCFPCPNGMFSFPNCIACEHYLQCDQVQYEVLTKNSLFTVGNWNYGLAEWRGYQVMSAAVDPRGTDTIDLFDRKIISPHFNLLYPVGFCGKTGNYIFWKSSKFIGPANQLDTLLLVHHTCDHWIVRFHLVIDFLRVLVNLHTAEGGPVVLCHSNSLNELLSQFLVTDNWSLVLASFDNLPQVKQENISTSGIKCTKHELTGNFISPEQRWPYRFTKVFDFNLQPGHTEASDIWKIPDFSRAILGTSDKSQHVLDHLIFMHYRCKEIDPNSRPSAVEILKEYERVWKMLAEPTTSI